MLHSKFVCPVCKKEGTIGVTNLKEYPGASLDCPNCQALLIVDPDDTSIKEFHGWLHSQEPKWPADGKNTGYMEF